MTKERFYRVEVSDAAGQIVAIETAMLAGRDIGQSEQQVIRWAIENLCGFVGVLSPPGSSFESAMREFEDGTGPLSPQPAPEPSAGYCPNCDCDYCGSVQGRLQRAAVKSAPEPNELCQCGLNERACSESACAEPIPRFRPAVKSGRSLRTPQGEPALTSPRELPGTREPVLQQPHGNAGESPALFCGCDVEDPYVCTNAKPHEHEPCYCQC